MKNIINKQAKVSDFISLTKQWNISNLRNIVADQIVDKIERVPISVAVADDMLTY